MSAWAWQTVSGSFVQPSTATAVWTGTGLTASGQLGTTGTTCADWVSASGTVALGLAQVATPNFMDSFGNFANCGNSYLLYCAEQ